eukprot:s47_g64.t1
MSSSESESVRDIRDVEMEGRDHTCHGLEFRFFTNVASLREFPTKKWRGINEGTWPRVLRGETIHLNVTGHKNANHKFLPQGQFRLCGFKCYWYRCATGMFRDIVIREVPGILMVKAYHIENPYKENSILVAIKWTVKMLEEQILVKVAQKGLHSNRGRVLMVGSSELEPNELIRWCDSKFSLEL